MLKRECIDDEAFQIDIIWISSSCSFSDYKFYFKVDDIVWLRIDVRGYKNPNDSISKRGNDWINERMK